MPKVFNLLLTPTQKQELKEARDHHPKPYVRERAAAILKVSAGQSIRKVALDGLLKPHSPHTVKAWIVRYTQEGVNGLLIKPGRGRKPPFTPRSVAEAKQEVEEVLHRSPRQYGINRNRWRLQDIGRAIHWLSGYTESGVYKVLKKLGFSYKKALRFIQSPDPEYRYKWEAILRAYQEAVSNPKEVIFLFQDEFTYYRRAKLQKTLQRRGSKQDRHLDTPGANRKARITAALNALTGQLHFIQRSKIGVKELVRFYGELREAYPEGKRIYLVEDNWPIHKHPEVERAAKKEGLRVLYLPTYASWLNPIEKVWHWVYQDVLYNHPYSKDFKGLKKEVSKFLEQFKGGSVNLLNYVGLLSKEEVGSMR